MTKARRSIRDYLSAEQRALPLQLTIDPGFVHKRRIQTILGPKGMGLIDELIQRLPNLPDWQRAVRIDHIYKDVFLEFCRIHNFPTLGDLLADETGRVFCSTERLGPCENFYDVTRAMNKLISTGRSEYHVEFQYTTEFVSSDTLKSRLHQGALISTNLRKSTKPISQKNFRV
jgi:hypothetical protein